MYLQTIELESIRTYYCSLQSVEEERRLESWNVLEKVFSRNMVRVDQNRIRTELESEFFSIFYPFSSEFRTELGFEFSRFFIFFWISQFWKIRFRVRSEIRLKMGRKKKSDLSSVWNSAEKYHRTIPNLTELILFQPNYNEIEFEFGDHRIIRYSVRFEKVVRYKSDIFTVC
jgi:hypothetical protein